MGLGCLCYTDPMTILLPLLVCLAGLLIFLLATTPKPQEIGKWMFVCGLFVSLLDTGPLMVGLLHRIG